METYLLFALYLLRSIGSLEQFWKKPEFDSRIGHHVKKGSVARVNRRLRRYYLIVRLLPNVFALACLSLSSI